MNARTRFAATGTLAAVMIVIGGCGAGTSEPASEGELWNDDGEAIDESELVTGAFGLPCEDLDNNGACDPSDPDITAQLLAGGFSTTESIVIPAGVRGLITPPSTVSLNLNAGKNITINSNLIAKHCSLEASAGGTISVGPKAAVRTAESIFFMAGGDIVLHPEAALLATQNAYGSINLYAQERVQLMERVRVMSRDAVYSETGKAFTVERGSTLNTSSLIVHVSDEVKVSGSFLNVGWYLRLDAYYGDLVDFQRNRVQVGRGGSVYLTTSESPSSTVNVSGTFFKNLTPDNLVIWAANVIGP